MKQDKIEEIKEIFIEKGAALEHVRWAKWQNYLHSFLKWNDDIKGWILPHEKKEWWQSEIETPYSMLNEKQKESDRMEVRKYLPLIDSLISSTYKLGYEDGQKDENKAWLNTERCFNCGGKKEGTTTADMCGKCYEEA